MMNYQKFYENFINTLNSLVTDKKELINIICNTLNINYRAAYRRVSGEYQFHVDEVLKLSSLLDISLDALIFGKNSDSIKITMNYHPFDSMSEVQRNSINKLLHKYKMAAAEKGSYILMACNMLPEIFCFQYEHLTKFNVFKWNYYANNSTSKNSLEEKKGLDSEYMSVIHDYIKTLYQFEKLLIIWDPKIIPSLINDIIYFSQIGYLNENHINLLKKDLYSLLERIKILCEEYVSPENQGHIIFSLSSINLTNSYYIVKGNDFKLALNSFFYTNYFYMSEPEIVQKMEYIINSILKSSMIISQSNEKERLKFIETNRQFIENIP